MEKKKRVYYEICLFILFSVALIQTLLQYVDFKELMEHIKYFCNLISGVIVVMFFDIFICVPIIGLFLGFKIAYKRHLKSKLEKIDFKNNNYFREIIDEYSIGAISYIDNFKVDSDDIIAVLLGLELKGKIKIGKQIRVVDQTEDGLMENEKYILKNLKENRLRKINIAEYTKILIEDCKNKNLLKEDTFYAGKFFRTRIIILLVLLALCPFLLNINASGVVLLIMLLIVPVLFVSTISLIALNYANPHVRSEEGQSLNNKIKGLKKYLKDYSNMEEKEKKELILWEDYLIYSIMFNQNRKIVEDIYIKL